jgi:CheY-like chemotaxis protein
MEIQMVPTPVPDRHELEATWRSNLEQARRRYDAAIGEYRRLLSEMPEGRPPDPDSELARAREAESDALAEYSRILRTFTRLTIDGKLPEDESAANLVVVIDDDVSIRDSVEALLRSAGHRVETFESAESFLDSAAATDTGCLILDVRMSGMNGPELQVRLSAGNSRIPIIFITAHYDNMLRDRVIQAGAVDMLRKPFAPNALLSMVRTAMGGMQHCG